MTKPGYTHASISKSLHSVLKEKAECEKTSIYRYIQGLIETEKNTADNREVRRSNRRGPIYFNR